MSDTQYLSPEGYQALKDEIQYLKSKGRQEVAKEIAEARAQGDLSENAEYDAAKEKQGMLEKRISELEATFAVAKVLDARNMDNTKVYVLSKVTVLNKKVNKKVTYTMVSPQEADFSAGKISIQSPIGAALLGKSVGDLIEVKVPAGILTFEILEIDR